MTNTNSNENFLSQKILQQGASIGSAPLLHPEQTNNNKIPNKTPTVDSGRAEACHDPTSWKIEESKVPQIPMYYSLEPGSLTVKEIPIDVISERIADFLRRYSISYSTEPHSSHLQCCTSNMLKFGIQFWRSQPLGELDSSMIVEMQRRQGSSIEMQRIRRAITREILFGEQTRTVQDFSTSPYLPESIMTASGLDDQYGKEARQVEAETICQNLLQSPCLDQFQLGLESLRMLSDPSIVSIQNARMTSRAILKIHGGAFSDMVQSKLAKCFAGTSFLAAHRYNTSVVDAEDEMQLTYSEGPCFEYAHNLGLIILGNALQVVLEDDGSCISDVAAAIDLNSTFWKRVNEHLVYDIERATQKPNEAAMSAKCIRLINYIAQKSQSLSDNHHFGPVSPSKTCLTQAFKFGQGCHLSLETETARLMAMEIDDINHIYAH